MVFDFGARFESGEINSIDEYFMLLDDNSQIKLRFIAGTHRDRFDKQLIHSEDFMAMQEELPELEQQLYDYLVKKNLLDKDVQASKRKIETSGHAPFINQICKLLIRKTEMKKNTLWIHGSPNSGKSTFLEIFQHIYPCANYKQTSSRFDCRYKRGKIAPSFVCIDGGALDNFFSGKDKYVTAKLFFEGKGIIQENKMEHPVERWKGVPIIIFG